MADLTSSKAKLNDSEVSDDAPLSEALNVKIGANINYLIDTTDDHETRISSIESTNLTKSSAATSSTTSATDVVAQQHSITPASSNVIVMLNGSLGASGAPTYTVTFTLKRGSTTLTTYSIVVTSGGTSDVLKPSEFNYMDTGATASSSNTYYLYAKVTSGGTATWSALQIGLYEPT